MDPVLRLIDANLNRAREGLRVVEDYARFVRDDAAIGEALKSIRNRLAHATRAVADRAIVHRDTPGDVGTTYANADAVGRADLRDVVVANGKRVGESLRAVEEYLKTVDPVAARGVEACRYAFYDVEQKLAATFDGRRVRLAGVRLYVLITESQCAGRDWFEVARQALVGGADAIQLREKSLESGELLARARRLVTLCREHDALFFVNDRPDVAVFADADGVHVGQGDLPAREARKIVGPDRLIGVSTHTLEHAAKAMDNGADYIGVGPMFRSATKPRDFVSDHARAVATSVSIPAVGIAGITLDNLDEALATGLKAVAVTAAVCAAPDVFVAAREFKTRLLAANPT